jgi:hypothetical protein
MKKIQLSDQAIRSIAALQHNAGSADLYINTLKSIKTYILHCSEEFGMSDTEAMSTMRALDLIELDIRAISMTPENDPTGEHYTAVETDYGYQDPANNNDAADADNNEDVSIAEAD